MIDEIYQTAKDKGFWEGEVNPEKLLSKMCLIHSEVSEVMEAYRKSHGSDKIMEEFADIFIRCYDLIAGMYYAGVVDTKDINSVIQNKMKINSERPKKHGNLI